MKKGTPRHSILRLLSYVFTVHIVLIKDIYRYLIQVPKEVILFLAYIFSINIVVVMIFSL